MIRVVLVPLFELAMHVAEDALSYAEIKEQTKMNDEDLTRSLHSLSCAKYKILLKSPTNNRINKADQFKLNLEFQDKARRIKVILFCCFLHCQKCTVCSDTSSVFDRAARRKWVYWDKPLLV